MTKIFKQAKDKNVAKVIVYGHTDNFLYSDAAHTTKLNKSELKDLFLKGCLIKTASGDLTPVKYLEAETYTGFVAKTDAASASFYSDGYVAPTEEHLFDEDMSFSYDAEQGGYADIFLTTIEGINTTDTYSITIGSNAPKNITFTDMSQGGTTMYVAQLQDGDKTCMVTYIPNGITEEGTTYYGSVNLIGYIEGTEPTVTVHITLDEAE